MPNPSPSLNPASLTGVRVWLSGSLPETDISTEARACRHPGICRPLFGEMYSNLAEHIIHGSHPSFTPHALGPSPHASNARRKKGRAHLGGVALLVKAASQCRYCPLRTGGNNASCMKHRRHPARAPATTALKFYAVGWLLAAMRLWSSAANGGRKLPGEQACQLKWSLQWNGALPVFCWGGREASPAIMLPDTLNCLANSRAINWSGRRHKPFVGDRG